MIAKGGSFDSLKNAIAERETELKTVQKRVLTAGRDEVNFTEFRAYIKRKFTDVRGLLHQGLASDPAVAKHWINEHLGIITMTPTLSADGKRRFYTASGKWEILPARPIAGGGFEPPTFGL